MKSRLFEKITKKISPPPNRILRISVVSKSHKRLREYTDLLQTSSHLLDIDNRIKPLNPESPEAERKNIACSSDVVVTDDNKFAEEVRECGPDIRIVGISENPEQELQYIKQEREGAVNCFYLRGRENPETLGELVRKNAFKKVHIGIIGRGKQGVRFVQRFYESDFVESIATWSERADRGLIHPLLEKIPGRDTKYSEPETLENLLEVSDILLICSSTLPNKEIVRRTEKDPTRSSIFPYEADKFYNYFKIIASEQRNTGDRKPILIYSNPPGPLMLLAERLGVDKNRLTSGSFANNVSRFYEEILGVMVGDSSLTKEDFDKAAEDARRNVVGVHGSPFYIGDKSGFPKIITDEVIKSAEERATRAGRLSQQAGETLDVVSEMTQRALQDFVNRIAHYEQPYTNDYTFLRVVHNGKEFLGFPTIPLRISYASSYPSFLKYPKIIRTFNQTFIPRIAPYLEEQQTAVEKFLRKKQSRKSR